MRSDCISLCFIYRRQSFCLKAFFGRHPNGRGRLTAQKKQQEHKAGTAPTTEVTT